MKTTISIIWRDRKEVSLHGTILMAEGFVTGQQWHRNTFTVYTTTRTCCSGHLLMEAEHRCWIRSQQDKTGKDNARWPPRSFDPAYTEMGWEWRMLMIPTAERETFLHLFLLLILQQSTGWFHGWIGNLTHSYRIMSSMFSSWLNLSLAW